MRARAPASPYPLAWTPAVTFLQPDTERALRERLVAKANIDLFLETPVTAFEQDSQSVTLMLERGGRSERLTARYLVGCDGANSFVRKRLGITHTDLAFDEQWIVVDALTSDPQRRPNKCFQYRPSRPGAYIPGPGTLRRWKAKLLPGERAEEFAGPGRILDVLSDFTDPSDLTIWRSAVYRFHALLAQRWRTGRVFLMGDAAHQTPPFLGQGFSAGVRDAVNLAWKMEFVLAGKAADQLLDTYQTERAPHVGTVVATAKAFGEIIGQLDPKAARKRDERLREELRSGTAQTIRQRFIPDLRNGLIAAHAKLSGALFVQPFVHGAPGERRRLDDLLKPGFVIAAASPATLTWLSEDAIKLWQGIGGEFVVVTTDQAEACGVLTVRETEDLFALWLKTAGVGAVIVRPDRYVFGGAENAAELDNLVRELADNLPRPS